MNLKQILEKLRRSGHKITPQRIEIIKLVMDSQEHLTPAAIFEKVRQSDPEVGEVTVYRTLNILSELGIVCLVHTGDNAHSYIVRPPGHHDHLICSGCGKVVNFTGCNLQDLEKRLHTETHFAIKEHHLEFYGECPECRLKS